MPGAKEDKVRKAPGQLLTHSVSQVPSPPPVASDSAAAPLQPCLWTCWAKKKFRLRLEILGALETDKLGSKNIKKTKIVQKSHLPAVMKTDIPRKTPKDRRSASR